MEDTMGLFGEELAYYVTIIETILVVIITVLTLWIPFISYHQL